MQRNKGNAGEAAGRLRVVHGVLKAVMDNLEKREGPDSVEKHPELFEALKLSSARCALKLAQLKKLCDKYCAAPSSAPKGGRGASPWAQAWNAVEAFAVGVQNTVVQMVSAETFASHFEEMMRALDAEMRTLHVALSAQTRQDINKMMERSLQPLRRHEELYKKIAASLDEQQETIVDNHAAVMEKLTPLSRTLDAIFEEQRRARAEILAGQGRVAGRVDAAARKLGGKLDLILDLLNNADDREVQGIVESDFPQRCIDRREVKIFRTNKGFLGKGGFGRVFLGKWGRNDVAIKESEEVFADDEWQRTKMLFMREICLW